MHAEKVRRECDGPSGMGLTNVKDTSLETVGQKSLSLSGYYGDMSQNLYNKGVMIGQSFRTVGSISTI